MGVYSGGYTPQLVNPTKYIPVEKLRGLAAKNSNITFLSIASCYILIFAAVSIYAFLFANLQYYANQIHPAILVACIPLALLLIVFVGSRQFALTILMHDGAHYSLHPNPKINNFLSDWFCGFIFLGNTTRYRQSHFEHHRYTETDYDPDLWLSQAYPTSKGSLTGKLLRDITGITAVRGYIRQFKTIYQSSRRAAETVDGGEVDMKQVAMLTASKLSGFLLTNTIVFMIFFILTTPWYFIFFWVIPHLTWYKLMERIRYIGEHAGVTGDSPLNLARTTISPLWIRWAIAPCNVNYHAEHHLMPSVSWHQLPKLHKLLGEEGHHNDMYIERDGYSQVLRNVVE